MIKKLFRSPPPVGDVIFQAIHKLKIQRFKLERVVVRLRERDKILFESCVTSVKNQNKERATIFATELAEVRRLIDTVSKTEITIERIILRLETIKELNNIVTELRPALKALQGVARCINRVMPEMAYELEAVNDSITETLAVTKMGSPQPVIPLDVKTPAAKEILKEASGVLGDQIMEKLPEPPVSVPQKIQTKKNIKQMVALAASCSTEKNGNEEPQTYLELQRVSFTLEKSPSVEATILDYIKKCNGHFDVAQCAFDLNVPHEKIEEILEKLCAKGKIQLRR